MLLYPKLYIKWDKTAYIRYFNIEVSAVSKKTSVLSFQDVAQTWYFLIGTPCIFLSKCFFQRY